MKKYHKSRRIQRMYSLMILALLLSIFNFACGNQQQEEKTKKNQTEMALSDSSTPVKAEPLEKIERPAIKLPDDIEWLTNDKDPVFASPKAKKGGIFRDALSNFPLTFRTVGPDSNLSSGFRSAVSGNQYGLIGLHPNTMNIIPEIATHWAFGKDKKTMYFKLNPKAVWSDGHPVTAEDFEYTLEFMRSPYIIAPWYNDYYTKEIESVIVYDNYTLAVISTKAKPDLHLILSISPTPKHFYGKLDEEFVKKYNWKIVPNTGPYQISDFEKGKNVKFRRKKDWWGKNLKYFQNRFNVDMVIFDVVKDYNLQWEYFKKGRIDTFGLRYPHYWHEKSDTPVINKGYVHKIWFYNDTVRPTTGLWLNQSKEIFKDRYVRYAFAHAMNIEKVITQVLRNDFFRLENETVGYGPYSNTNIKARRFDLNKVKEYMTKAGWKRGPDGIWEKDKIRFSVDITYGFDDHTPRLAVLKEEAKKAGIELNLQLLDPTAWYKKITEKKHDVSYGGFTANLRPSYWQGWHSDNAHKPKTNNITETDNAELDKLIEKFRDSLDEQERINLSKEIQEKLYEICAFVPTFMTPYVREAYWRWWRLPKVPGTKHTESLFALFSSGTGGLCWYDEVLHMETKSAMKSGMTFEPVTIIDETYRMTP